MGLTWADPSRAQKNYRHLWFAITVTQAQELTLGSGDSGLAYGEEKLCNASTLVWWGYRWL